MAAPILLVVINLRPSLTSVGPLLPQIGGDVGLSEAWQGALGALPLVAFAIASPLMHRLARRTGLDGALLLALVVLAAAVVARSYAGLPGLWVGTAVIGVAIAVGNVLVPVVVRRDHPTRISRVTGLTSAGMTAAAAIGSGVAVPLAAVTTWRESLAVWAVPAAVVALGWVVVSGIRRDRRAPALTATDPLGGLAGPVATQPPVRVPLWRQPAAWLITAFMGLQSTVFYVMVTWLPTIEAAVGIVPATAGLHLSIYSVVSAAGTLTIPFLMRRSGSATTAAVVSSAPMLVAVAGLLLAPSTPLPWVVLAGFSSGSSLVVALSLISSRAGSNAETARLSGMAQSIGYLLAASGPVAVGALAQATGAWRAPLLLVGGIAMVQLVVALVAGRESTRLHPA